MWTKKDGQQISHTGEAHWKIPIKSLFLDAASLNANEPFLDELILETMDMGGKPPSSKWSAL